MSLAPSPCWWRAHSSPAGAGSHSRRRMAGSTAGPHPWARGRIPDTTASSWPMSSGRSKRREPPKLTGLHGGRAWRLRMGGYRLMRVQGPWPLTRSPLHICPQGAPALGCTGLPKCVCVRLGAQCCLFTGRLTGKYTVFFGEESGKRWSQPTPPWPPWPSGQDAAPPPPGRPLGPRAERRGCCCGCFPVLHLSQEVGRTMK